MRHRLLAVPMLLLLLLTACGSGETSKLQAALAFRAALLAADGCRFTAQTQLDVQGSVYGIVLDCESFPDGSATMTVRTPESLEGVTAELSGKSGKLSYDGTAVDFGLFEDESVAPIALPALLAAYWREAYIYAAGPEDGLLRVSLQDDMDPRELTVDTWLDESGRPIYAEITLRGSVIAAITLENFELLGGTT